ncbi:MAG: ATP-binding protein [Chitinophagales bacterium]|jgi:hypothetical protein|nr:ATP-binding protein [Chitinophagales bacterium]
MSILRQIHPQILEDCFKQKIILLLGARQVGKSTLVRMITESFTDKILWLDGDDVETAALFAESNRHRLSQIVGTHKIVVIDEAQKIHKIGTILKLLIDYQKDIQVIITGSSAFELRDKLNEPLTGRKFMFSLYPLSFPELSHHFGFLEEKRNLPERLVYGAYPEVITTSEPKERVLRLLSDSYLYKDIFLFKGLKKPEKMLELLRLLAWQIGSEVNINELSKTLKIDNQTVESYLEMLEQAFVIFRLRSYHTNQRNELKKSKKIYFYDLGIRNAIINDFRPVELRQDVGALFENYVIVEMLKQNEYLQTYANLYFWRTSEQKEIDLILEKNGKLLALEMKWNPQKKVKLTKSFSNIYPNHSFYEVNRENYMDFFSKDFFEKL